MTTATLDLKALASPDAPDDLEWKVQRAGEGGLWQAKVSPTGIIDATADGVITCLPSVTGIVDEVQDVIEPGAYAETLKVRVPKGVWSHDWSVWVARTDDVKELLPGDSMLPRKWKGRDWPRGAGATIVQATFNLGTQAGHDAYSNVKFFDQGPLGQQVELSIGYRVNPAKTTRDGKGWRRIAEMDGWFEWCPVLFGAMPLAGVFAGDERKTLESGGQPSREVIVVHAPTPEPAAKSIADRLRALAPATDDERKAIELEVASAHWTPTEDDLKAAHAADLEVKLAGREATPTDVRNTERLKRYWTHGKGGAEIRWGEPGDFGRCDRHLAKYIADPSIRKGFCALRHHDATGAWPGHAPTEQTKGAGVTLEGKAAGSMAKATTHEPVGKGPLWKHKGWQLPAYIQHVANDLREKGHDKSRAIAMAVGIIKNWAHGHDGKGGKVKPSTQAAAAKALAQWTALKAKAGAERAAKAGKKGLDIMGEGSGTTTDLTDEELAELGAGLLDDAGGYADPDDDDPDDELATGTEPDDPAYPTGENEPAEGKDLEGKAAAMKCGKSAKDCPHTHPGDTAYPIHDAGELADAVAAYPRGAGKGGKTKASIRAHIARAGRRLGKANKVPRNWPEKREGKTFEEALDEALEAKDYPWLPGSVEERQNELREALRDLLLPEPDENGQRRAYVSLDATYADRVVATLTDYSIDPSEEQTFEIPYTYTADDDGDGEVAFGDPVPKKKVVSVEMQSVTDDGPGGPTQQAVGGDAPLGGANPLLPVARKLGTLAKTIEGALEYAADEGKDLTGDSHARRLRAALREVAGAAAGLGIDTDGAEALTVPAAKAADDELDPETKELLDSVDEVLGTAEPTAEDLLAAADAALAD